MLCYIILVHVPGYTVDCHYLILLTNLLYVNQSTKVTGKREQWTIVVGLATVYTSSVLILIIIIDIVAFLKYVRTSTMSDLCIQNTISLPPGVQLPPGTILMQNDKGQIVFMSRAPAPPQPVSTNFGSCTRRLLSRLATQISLWFI